MQEPYSVQHKRGRRVWIWIKVQFHEAFRGASSDGLVIVVGDDNCAFQEGIVEGRVGETRGLGAAV